VQQQKKDSAKACKASQAIKAKLVEEGKAQRRAAALKKQQDKAAKTAAQIHH
jgi:hypothetical protein